MRRAHLAELVLDGGEARLRLSLDVAQPRAHLGGALLGTAVVTTARVRRGVHRRLRVCKVL